jgi:hypothetical protein
MMSFYDQRAAELIVDCPEWTADDLTDDGAVTPDPDHAPNSANNGVGSYINGLSRRGLIAFTGQVVRSRAPHRKGGVIRVWTGTSAGRQWARTQLGR